MKNKMLALYGILAILLIGVGVVVYKLVVTPQTLAPAPEETVQREDKEPLDPNIKVEVAKSRTQNNTVVITVSGLGGKVQSVAYELTYESQGLVKGVNSGSKPMETAGQDGFERQIYLGTCSRNDCKPDLGVTKVTLSLEFNNTSGKKSQFSKDFDL